ncbi:hypothetical protein SAMN05720781_0462 [Fibrobacter sp. UWT3]|nr:hypothetical protein SAMN05720781_0462 [Fibrobacter sp. UWT3]
MQPGDVYQTNADTTKLEAECGYKPHWSLHRRHRRVYEVVQERQEPAEVGQLLDAGHKMPEGPGGPLVNCARPSGPSTTLRINSCRESPPPAPLRQAQGPSRGTPTFGCRKHHGVSLRCSHGSLRPTARPTISRHIKGVWKVASWMRIRLLHFFATVRGLKTFYSTRNLR